MPVTPRIASLTFTPAGGQPVEVGALYEDAGGVRLLVSIAWERSARQGKYSGAVEAVQELLQLRGGELALPAGVDARLRLSEPKDWPPGAFAPPELPMRFREVRRLASREGSSRAKDQRTAGR